MAFMLNMVILMDQQAKENGQIDSVLKTIRGPGWKALLAASMSIMISACADIDNLEKQEASRELLPAGSTDFDQDSKLSMLCFRFALTMEECQAALEES